LQFLLSAVAAELEDELDADELDWVNPALDMATAPRAAIATKMAERDMSFSF